jgi:glycosyltransferase involved in cell wall biosynthesis
LRLSVIIPFHNNLEHLARALEPFRERPSNVEVIVVADGARQDCTATAHAVGAVVLPIPGPSGPGAARNAGAAIATGDVLVFVDADVVAEPHNLARIEELLRSEPDVAAVFGAYDENPPEPHFISQYKNLAHSYIHQSSNAVAQTFWAGFGAIRTDAFHHVGGFDERFGRPSIEDIDLGHRLVAAGHQVRLDHELRVQHLKLWTLANLIVTDVRDRGIPWTQLILRSGRFQNDLNLRSAYRISVALAYLALLSCAAAIWRPWALWGALACTAAVVFLSRGFYAYFVQRRGLWFAARVLPLHFLYHLYNGVSFVFGTLIYTANRRWNVRLPGAVPLTPWAPPARVPASAASRVAAFDRDTITAAP